MPPETTQFPLPEQGWNGLAALVELGATGVKSLGEVLANAPLDLSFDKLFSRVAKQLHCKQPILRRAIMGALIPLNGVRRSLDLQTDQFLKSLATSVERRATQEWKDESLEGWNKIVPFLEPLFLPNNFFSQASKALELLSLRPAVFLQARIISELRPIFDEDTTQTLALLQTNTLVIQYWDGENEATSHLTLDDGDLDSLSSEIERAKKKTGIGAEEASKRGTPFVTYGSREAESGS